MDCWLSVILCRFLSYFVEARTRFTPLLFFHFYPIKYNRSLKNLSFISKSSSSVILFRYPLHTQNSPPVTITVFFSSFQIFILLHCLTVCNYQKQLTGLMFIFQPDKPFPLRDLSTGFNGIISTPISPRSSCTCLEIWIAVSISNALRFCQTKFNSENRVYNRIIRINSLINLPQFLTQASHLLHKSF